LAGHAKEPASAFGEDGKLTASDAIEIFTPLVQT